jgi:nucleoid-associated protein YgaU
MLTDARHPRAVFAAWSVILGAAVAVLHATGHGAMSPPPLAHLSDWPAWLADRTPVEAGFAIVRMGAVLAAWQLTATTAFGAFARLLGSRRLTGALDRVTAAPLRGLLSAAFGLGLATTTLTGSTAAFAGPVRPPSAETMVRDGGAPTTWSVRPGDSFWRIAHDVEAAADDHEPSDAEVAAFWLKLMDANRDRFRDPDVIYPEQRFDVPPPVD